MKKGVFFYFLCMLGLFIYAQIPMLPIDGIMPGVSSINEIGDSKKITLEGRVSYQLENIRVWQKNGIITDIVVSSSNDFLPEHWETMGFSWDLTYQELYEILLDAGFTIVRSHKPLYSLSGKNIIYSGEIQAVHPESSSLLYVFSLRDFSFHNKKKEEFKEILYKVLIKAAGEESLNPPLLIEEESEMISLLPKEREALSFSYLASPESECHLERLEPYDITNPNSGRRARLELNGKGIYTKSDLINLLSQGRGVELEKLLHRLDQNDISLHEYFFLEEIDTVTARQLLFLNYYRLLPGLDGNSLTAWTSGQNIYLCRLAFQAGYLEPAEAWNLINSESERIKGKYNIRENFSASYLWGELFKLAEEGKDRENLNPVLLFYSHLIGKGENAWNLPWNQGEGTRSQDNNPSWRFSDILSTRTDNEMAYEKFYKAVMLINNKYYEEARDILYTIKREKTDFPSVLYYLGLCDFYLGSITRAETFLSEFTEIHPEYYKGALLYGDILNRAGKYDQAVQLYLKIIEETPFRPEGYLELIDLSLDRDNLNRAAQYLELFHENIPEPWGYPYGIYLKGVLSVKKKEYETGLISLKKCEPQYGDNGFFKYLMGLCYLFMEEQNYHKAYDYFNGATEAGMNLPDNIKQFLIDWERKTVGDYGKPLV